MLNYQVGVVTHLGFEVDATKVSDSFPRRWFANCQSAAPPKCDADGYQGVRQPPEVGVVGLQAGAGVEAHHRCRDDLLRDLATP